MFTNFHLLRTARPATAHRYGANRPCSSCGSGHAFIHVAHTHTHTYSLTKHTALVVSQGTRHLWRRQFDGIMAALRILGCSFPPIRPVPRPTSALLKKACLHKPRGRCRKKPWPSRSCAASRYREALVDSQAIWTMASSVCVCVCLWANVQWGRLQNKRMKTLRMTQQELFL